MENTKKLCGAVAVTVTPFLRDALPDYEEIRKQTDFLARSSIDGIFPCSSTGEYPKIAFEDKIRIMETVAEVNAGRKWLVAGACAVSVAEIKAYIDAAKRLHYDAALICPPFYYPLGQNEVLRFYREVCAYAGELPVIAYNVPFFTTEITLETFAKLLEIPNIAGMKDSSGNLKKISHEADLAREKKPGFVLFTGTDDCLLPALAGGCRGSMTAFGAVFPEQIKLIYRHFEAGNIEEAIRAQRRILPLLRLCDSLTFPDGYKLMARVKGLKSGKLSEVTSPEREKELEAAMEDAVKKAGL